MPAAPTRRRNCWRRPSPASPPITPSTSRASGPVRRRGSTPGCASRSRRGVHRPPDRGRCARSWNGWPRTCVRPRAQGRGGPAGRVRLPLTTVVVCELVGIDDTDRDRVCAWIHDFAYGDGSRTVDGLVGIVATSGN
ncbi:hypothetical protein E4K10_37235 [Streptomyces sp. T1317-0309]|nr:hypothetical protein E4K10_37235 [Streptomyces sp. T1317-0309]